MNCFGFLKQRSRCRRAKSAPETQIKNNSHSNPETRSTKSLPTIVTTSDLSDNDDRNLRIFDFRELTAATDNFNRLQKLGEGGFGIVYRGSINPGNHGDPVIVAIKKLNRNSLQGRKEWLAEVRFLSIVDHPNLVKLLGCCSYEGDRGTERLLVYEYLTKGSFEHLLFRKYLPPLPWRNRLKIMLGAARGLAYLHGLETPVIYRDFKTSNILLDDELNPKLSDFGLAREGPLGDASYVSTAVVGTYGYMAPEYIETKHLKPNCDTWSFGVVLYEMLTGRRAVDPNRPKPERRLLEWVKLFPSESKRFGMIMDPRLGGEYSVVDARRIARLGDRCLIKSARERPEMGEVVEIMEQIIHNTK